jgi:4-carboxymuconolactone decarboxylase
MPTDALQPEGGWAGPARPRLAAPAPADRGPLLRAASGLSALLGRRGVPDVISVLHIHPRLFWPWLLFASRLMPYGRLPTAMREKIILRTAWNCRSRYEWGQHVAIARRVGVSPEEIVRVAGGPEACTDRHERAVLQACDEVCRDRSVSDATWQVLAERHSESALIEILLLIGHYEMIAGFLNSAGLVLEPSKEEKLRAFHQLISR